MLLALLFSLLLVSVPSFHFHWIQRPLCLRVGVSLLRVGVSPHLVHINSFSRCSFLSICDRAEIYSLQTKQSLQYHFFSKGIAGLFWRAFYIGFYEEEGSFPFMNFLFASFLCVLFLFFRYFSSKDRGFKAIQSAPIFYHTFDYFALESLSRFLNPSELIV